MAKILIFNPPSRSNVYLSTNVRVGAPSYPSLTLATLAAHVVRDHEVKLIDLDFVTGADNFFKELGIFKPDVLVSTANTPDYLLVRDIMSKAKERQPSLKTVVGGVHITALPQEAAKEKCFDILAIGEADGVLFEIMSGRPLKEIPGIIYRDNPSGENKNTGPRKLIDDLNTLPFPAWHLFALNKYRNSRLSSRKNPVGLIETSRGCAFQCNFCNKLTFGTKHRVKSPMRVVDEMEYTCACGFREIHIIDDSFTQDIRRAKDICREIIRRNLRFPWSSLSGVRVDMVDEEFFSLAKQSGCWQVGFGIETGNEEILDKINKKTNLTQVENAVRLARKAGVNTFGFFILGLTGETEKTMQRTIEFSKKLPLDIAKFDICIPYPGTPYYRDLEREDRIRSRNWLKYVCHQVDEPLFEHPNVTWDTLRKYYKKAFKEFYLRPAYIAQRLARSLKSGDIFYDISYFLKSRF